VGPTLATTLSVELGPSTSTCRSVRRASSGSSAHSENLVAEKLANARTRETITRSQVQLTIAAGNSAPSNSTPFSLAGASRAPMSRMASTERARQPMYRQTSFEEESTPLPGTPGHEVLADTGIKAPVAAELSEVTYLSAFKLSGFNYTEPPPLRRLPPRSSPHGTREPRRESVSRMSEVRERRTSGLGLGWLRGRAAVPESPKTIEDDDGLAAGTADDELEMGEPSSAAPADEGSMGRRVPLGSTEERQHARRAPARPAGALPVVRAWWMSKPMPRRCLPYEIASISEGKISALASQTPVATLRAYHERQLSRVFPMGTRFGSSNIPPVRPHAQHRRAASHSTGVQPAWRASPA
jgi:hypothetical protein